MASHIWCFQQHNFTVKTIENMWNPWIAEQWRKSREKTKMSVTDSSWYAYPFCFSLVVSLAVPLSTFGNRQIIKPGFLDWQGTCTFQDWSIVFADQISHKKIRLLHYITLHEEEDSSEKWVQPPTNHWCSGERKSDVTERARDRETERQRMQWPNCQNRAASITVQSREVLLLQPKWKSQAQKCKAWNPT